MIVFLCAFPAENGLVVDLDELPFRTMAEVSKKAAEVNDNVSKRQSNVAHAARDRPLVTTKLSLCDRASYFCNRWTKKSLFYFSSGDIYSTVGESARVSKKIKRSKTRIHNN